MKLPQYFVVGSTAVKAIETADGGMDVLAYDAASDTFVRAMHYLTRITFAASDPEIDRVTEAAFDEWVAELRRRAR
jgi:hypothetical protein